MISLLQGTVFKTITENPGPRIQKPTPDEGLEKNIDPQRRPDSQNLLSAGQDEDSHIWGVVWV